MGAPIGAAETAEPVPLGVKLPATLNGVVLVVKPAPVKVSVGLNAPEPKIEVRIAAPSLPGFKTPLESKYFNSFNFSGVLASLATWLTKAAIPLSGSLKYSAPIAICKLGSLIKPNTPLVRWLSSCAPALPVEALT